MLLLVTHNRCALHILGRDRQIVENLLAVMSSVVKRNKKRLHLINMCSEERVWKAHLNYSMAQAHSALLDESLDKLCGGALLPRCHQMKSTFFLYQVFSVIFIQLLIGQLLLLDWELATIYFHHMSSEKRAVFLVSGESYCFFYKINVEKCYGSIKPIICVSVIRCSACALFQIQLLKSFLLLSGLHGCSCAKDRTATAVSQRWGCHWQRDLSFRS